MIVNRDPYAVHVRAHRLDQLLDPGQEVEMEVGKSLRLESVDQPWMRAHVYGLYPDVRWYAVSAEDGTFELPDVEPGSWTVEVWHDASRDERLKLVVPEGGAARLVLECRGGRIRRAK